MLTFRRRNRSPFVTEDAFKENLRKQLSMTPMTLNQLRQHGLKIGASLRLEYFFYSNSEARARALAQELEVMGYSSEARESAHDKQLYVITGWTSPLPMDDGHILTWTETMCRLGLVHDCDFDGWGTYPTSDDQDGGA